MASKHDFKMQKDEVDMEILKEFKGDDPVQRLYKIWEENSTRRIDFHRNWIVCMKFLQGKQWLGFTPKSARVYELANNLDSRKADIVRATINRILPAYDLKMGQLTDVLHVPEVIPAAGRADAYELARMETQFLQAMWWRRRLDELDEEIKANVTTYGLAWLKTTFNHDEKLVDYDALSPFEVLPVPFGVKTPESASMFIETQAFPLDKLKTMYSSLKDWTEEELQEEILTLIASTDTLGTGASIDHQVKGLVPIREAYAPPSEKHPRGFKIIATRKRLLELKPLKYPERWHPYERFTYRHLSGAMYPPGLVFPMLRSQVLYNKVTSDIIQGLHMAGHPRLMVPASLNINIDDFDDTNSPIEYDDDDANADVKPWHLDPPPMDGDLWNQRSALRQDSDDISHVHPASRGEKTPGVTSGKQTGLLQAPDAQHLSPLLKDISRSWGHVFDTTLFLQGKEQGDDVLNLPGVDPSTTTAFTLEDFKSPDESGRRVRVRTIQTGPYERERLEQKNDRMMQYGMFDDLPRTEARRIMASGVDGTLFPPYAADHIYARQENKQLLDGDLDNIRVNQFDNDEAHIEEHRKIQMHSRWDGLDQQIKVAVTQHVSSHEKRIAEAQQGQADMEQGAAGNAPGPQEPAPAQGA